ncbi:hypothetical protein CMUS01_15050 [Colletotrichum musicola]|uniref:Uncharacterized protein n=1 Tax=Colletotrichum musicola TaxID=2175873 RepID=A0A8H6J022_9PEZI|nr:hypothetical protein CMUS01_15050 [Colletotrichum musicola]
MTPANLCRRPLFFPSSGQAGMSRPLFPGEAFARKRDGGGNASAVNREINPQGTRRGNLGRLCFRWDAVEATSACSGEVLVAAGDVAPILGLPRRTCCEGEGARWDGGWRVLATSGDLVWFVVQRLGKRYGQVWMSERSKKDVSCLKQDCPRGVLSTSLRLNALTEMALWTTV